MSEQDSVEAKGVKSAGKDSDRIPDKKSRNLIADNGLLAAVIAAISSVIIVFYFAPVSWKADVVCPPLSIKNAALNTTDANYSTAVLATCKPGYAIDPLDSNNKTAVTVCTGSGNWSTSIKCSAVVVCPPLNIVNAALNTTNVQYSTTVRVTCDSGYAIDPRDVNNNNALTVCTRSGKWSKLIVCSAVVCPPLSIANAVLSTTDTAYSTSVRVTCNSGYAIDPLNVNDNTASTVCTSSGTWSSTIFCSAVVVCPPLNIPNAVLSTTDTIYSTSVLVTCNPGYAIDPLNLDDYTASTYCTSTGTWSTGIVCSAVVVCPPLSIANAALSTTDTVYSTLVLVTCNPGYAIDPLNLNDNIASTYCTSTGTWSTAIVCSAAVVCPPLNIPNAVLDTTDTIYSTSVLVTCNPGYAIDPLKASENTASTVCTSSGTWSTAIVCSAVPITFSSPFAPVAGVGTASCSPGQNLLSCGVENGVFYQYGYGMAVNSTSCECTSDKGFCMPWCTNAAVQGFEIVTSPEMRGTFTAMCPEGKKVLGCARKPRNPALTSPENFPQFYPNSNGDGCTCYDEDGAQCVATCASNIANHEVVANDDTTNNVFSFCSPGNYVLGCGIALHNISTTSIPAPLIYINDNVVNPHVNNKCDCYVTFNTPVGTTCYATCGQFV